MSVGLAFEQVSFRYPTGGGLTDVSFAVPVGATLALIGPAGAGKSTLLRLAAGLDSPSAGTIRLLDQDVTRWPPWRRPVALVPQRPALFPHLDVRGNIGFALNLLKPRPPRAEINRRCAEAAELLNLTALLARKADELSGGERQRVALARAVARGAAVWLLDEPFTALDWPARAESMRKRRTIFRKWSHLRGNVGLAVRIQ